MVVQRLRLMESPNLNSQDQLCTGIIKYLAVEGGVIFNQSKNTFVAIP